MKIKKSVYDVVVATVADYKRMKEIIECGDGSRDQLAKFVKSVSAIDNAFMIVCEGERDEAKAALMVDIAERRGFERAVSRQYYTTKKTFENRKAQAVSLIAQLLLLV